jgi:hypothetical protein
MRIAIGRSQPRLSHTAWRTAAKLWPHAHRVIIERTTETDFLERARSRDVASEVGVGGQSAENKKNDSVKSRKIWRRALYYCR